MLEDIHNLAVSYLDQKDELWNGKIKNPFAVGTSLAYYTGLIEGRCPLSMVTADKNFLKAINARRHIEYDVSSKNEVYKYAKRAYKLFPNLAIKYIRFSTFNVDQRMYCLKCAAKYYLAHPLTYNDSNIYRLFIDCNKYQREQLYEVIDLLDFKYPNIFYVFYVVRQLCGIQRFVNRLETMILPHVKHRSLFGIPEKEKVNIHKMIDGLFQLNYTSFYAQLYICIDHIRLFGDEGCLSYLITFLINNNTEK